MSKPNSTYTVSRKTLLELGPDLAAFGVKVWIGIWKRYNANIYETVDWDTGNYIYRAIEKSPENTPHN
jgi:hypothetical protein